MTEGNVDVALVTAEEILKCAEEEFEKAIKTKDVMLYSCLLYTSDAADE